jgi:hypothetical protein
MYDWKRSCKLTEKQGFRGKTMDAPLGHLPDSRYWQHAMQPPVCTLCPLLTPPAHLLASLLTSLPPSPRYWHYAMQLNIYRYILQRKYGKTIVGMYLLGLHPDLDQGESTALTQRL